MKRWVFLIVALWLPLTATAHETTLSYLTVSRDENRVNADLRVAIRDLEVAVWLDADLDGRISWAETTARLPAVLAYVQARLTLRTGGPCTLAQTGAGVSDNGGVAYLDLDLAGTCPADGGALTVRSSLFADLDPDHRLFLTTHGQGRATTIVLGPGTPAVSVGSASGGGLATFLAYLRAGAEHLAGGADHIVFLLVLMLPAVATATNPQRAAAGVAMAATGFTVAHAITLSAATLQVLRPRTDVIELLIALSIIVTAADNIRPFLPAPRTVVAAFFGLIHGFGFATVLGGLPVSPGTLAIALFGFNIGIEAAQIGLILVTLPALYMLRGGRRLVWAGSAAAMAVGVYWCTVRLSIGL